MYFTKKDLRNAFRLLLAMKRIKIEKPKITPTYPLLDNELVCRKTSRKKEKKKQNLNPSNEFVPTVSSGFSGVCEPSSFWASRRLEPSKVRQRTFGKPPPGILRAVIFCRRYGFHGRRTLRITAENNNIIVRAANRSNPTGGHGRNYGARACVTVRRRRARGCDATHFCYYRPRAVVFEIIIALLMHSACRQWRCRQWILGFYV